MEDKHKKEDSVIKIKKDTIWKIGTFVFAILFVISLLTGGFGIGTNSQPLPAANNNPTTGNAITSAKDLVDNDPMLGNKNAPLTIVEFSDFQCPYCGRFRTETLDQIKSEYVDTGKVNFVYRDFPLTSIHPNAQPAAEAAECANEQGKYWEYHDILFSNQQSLSTSNYKKWAADLGLNTDKFNDCVDSRKYKDEVEKDSADAQAAGGRGTPYFIIGSTPLSGAQPFANFKAVIDAELAN